MFMEIILTDYELEIYSKITLLTSLLDGIYKNNAYQVWLAYGPEPNAVSQGRIVQQFCGVL